jgi:hypothetical protein
LLSEERQKEGIVNFFLSDGRVEGYLDRGQEVGSRTNPGKLGELRNAFTLIADDPITLVFGIGMGNLSDSALGDQFKGEYFDLYGHLAGSALPTMISELGILGLGLLCLLYWVIFGDCVRVARIDGGLYGALALGWTGAVIALFVGLAQTFPIANPALSMLFWYFTGIVAAQRSRQEAVDLRKRSLSRPTYHTAVSSSSPPGAAT